MILYSLFCFLPPSDSNPTCWIQDVYPKSFSVSSWFLVSCFCLWFYLWLYLSLFDYKSVSSHLSETDYENRLQETMCPSLLLIHAPFGTIFKSFLCLTIIIYIRNLHIYNNKKKKERNPIYSFYWKIKKVTIGWKLTEFINESSFWLTKKKSPGLWNSHL